MEFTILGADSTIGPDPEFHKDQVVSDRKGNLGEVIGWVQFLRDKRYVYLVEFSRGRVTIDGKYLTYIGEL